MDWKKTPYALPALALGGLFLCLFVIFPMVGISVLDSQNLSLALTLSKIIMILLASACGFVLGWFFSPSAKGVRHIFCGARGPFYWLRP